MTEFEMELTQKYARDYARENKRTKSAILDEYCRLSGAGRNTAAQRFRRKHRRRYPGILPSSRKPRGTVAT